MSARVLFVCTANICRSPMAALLFRTRGADLLPDWRAGSAGIDARAERAVPDDVIAALGRRGVAFEAHTPTPVGRELLQRADLVVAMDRSHLVEVVAAEPQAFGRTFLLSEIVELGRREGARRTDESLAEWLGRLHGGRSPADVLRLDSSYDIDDPYGGKPSDYDRCAERLDTLIQMLVALLAGEHEPARQ